MHILHWNCKIFNFNFNLNLYNQSRTALVPISTSSTQVARSLSNIIEHADCEESSENILNELNGYDFDYDISDLLDYVVAEKNNIE